jgi:hypothetical protein
MQKRIIISNGKKYRVTVPREEDPPQPESVEINEVNNQNSPPVPVTSIPFNPDVNHK